MLKKILICTVLGSGMIAHGFGSGDLDDLFSNNNKNEQRVPGDDQRKGLCLRTGAVVVVASVAGALFWMASQNTHQK